MAKVYEALQKAEEERRRRSAGELPAAAQMEWSPDDSVPSSVRDGRSFLQRMLDRRRAGAPRASASELNKRRISLIQPESYVAEQFRTLRGRIDSLATERPIRTLAVTSANPGEGKSTASVNLAAVTAMSVGRDTLLIDCDFRRPEVHRSLGLEPHVGLAEVLLDKVSLDDALIKVEGLNLQVLAVRMQPANPSELLSSGRMRSLIEECSKRFDRTILDTPATLGLPDGKTLAELADGSVMIVRADVTPREDVEAALDVLGRKRLLGLVLNGSESAREYYGYY